jgi:uncharacterized protein YkwD
MAWGKTLMALALTWGAMAQAQADQGTEELAGLINAYRAAPEMCQGRVGAKMRPLTLDEALSSLRVDAGALRGQLEKEGYPLEGAMALMVEGPPDAQAAWGMILKKYCAELLSREASVIGVAREGARWQVVLTRAPAAALAGSMEAGQELLERVNQARSRPRRCGQEEFAAAPPLRWSQTLATAAQSHSDDMANRGYFAHVDPQGRKPSDRAQEAGYRYWRVGENIAMGQRDVDEALTAWLESPGHCANIMRAQYVEMGAAYALGAGPKGSARALYWTQSFGAPR